MICTTAMSSKAVRSKAKAAWRIIEESDGEPTDPVPESFRATAGEKSAYRMVAKVLDVGLSGFIRNAIRNETKRLSAKS